MRANINRLVGGAGEETILARVGEGIVSTIGSAASHKAVLENPDLISKTVLAKGLDAGTAFEILSIDIADVDVGKNIGAELQTDQAEADKRIAQAKAEERRALAVAMEQEFKAEAQNQRAKVIAAEAQIPLAMAEAFRSGNLGVMDYQRYRNIQADTTMRQAIAGGGDSAPTAGAERWTSAAAAARLHLAGGERPPQGGQRGAPGSRRGRPPPPAADGRRRTGRAGRAARLQARGTDAAWHRRATPPSARDAGWSSCCASWAARWTRRPGPLGRRPTGALPPAEEVEERESLEVAPEVRSLETGPRGASGRRWIRTTRPSGWSRAGGAAAEAQRGAADTGGSSGVRRADPAGAGGQDRDAGATRPQQLREAMVWREILGPPVSLRREDGASEPLSAAAGHTGAELLLRTAAIDCVIDRPRARRRRPRSRGSRCGCPPGPCTPGRSARSPSGSAGECRRGR